MHELAKVLHTFTQRSTTLILSPQPIHALPATTDTVTHSASFDQGPVDFNHPGLGFSLTQSLINSAIFIETLDHEPYLLDDVFDAKVMYFEDEVSQLLYELGVNSAFLVAKLVDQGVLELLNLEIDVFVV